MNSYDKIYNLLLEEPLSQPAKKTLALNRLSRKAFKDMLIQRGFSKAVAREQAKETIKTNPKRDVVRAAALAQISDQVFHDKTGKRVKVEVKPEAEEMMQTTRHQGHGPQQRAALGKFKRWVKKANKDTKDRPSTDAEKMLVAQLRAAGTTGGRGAKGSSLADRPGMGGYLTRIKRR